MKSLAPFLVCLGCAASALGEDKTNQTNAVTASAEISPEQRERLIQFQRSTVNRVLGISTRPAGVVPIARNAGSPWQLINPLAPAQMGDAMDNVSLNPHSMRPEGIHLFVIKF